jgi:4-aminobutyrate aminotransferase-like enzyme
MAAVPIQAKLGPCSPGDHRHRRQCFRHGLLAIFAFNRQSTLQMMPPLTIEPEQIDELLKRLDPAVAALTPHR